MVAVGGDICPADEKLFEAVVQHRSILASLAGNRVWIAPHAEVDLHHVIAAEPGHIEIGLQLRKIHREGHFVGTQIEVICDRPGVSQSTIGVPGAPARQICPLARTKSSVLG